MQKIHHRGTKIHGDTEHSVPLWILSVSVVDIFSKLDLKKKLQLYFLSKIRKRSFAVFPCTVG